MAWACAAAVQWPPPDDHPLRGGNSRKPTLGQSNLRYKDVIRRDLCCRRHIYPAIQCYQRFCYRHTSAVPWGCTVETSRSWIDSLWLTRNTNIAKLQNCDEGLSAAGDETTDGCGGGYIRGISHSQIPFFLMQVSRVSFYVGNYFTT